MTGVEGDRLATINISRMKLLSPVIFPMGRGLREGEISLLQSWAQQNVPIVLSGPSVPSLKMLSSLDPADLKLQFYGLDGSAFPGNQPHSELRLPRPQPC